MKLVKTSEKILIWLYRVDKTQIWLAEQLGCTRQALSINLKDNCFSIKDILKIKQLGCPLE